MVDHYRQVALLPSCENAMCTFRQSLSCVCLVFTTYRSVTSKHQLQTRHVQTRVNSVFLPSNTDKKSLDKCFQNKRETETDTHHPLTCMHPQNSLVPLKCSGWCQESTNPGDVSVCLCVCVSRGELLLCV